MYLLESTPFINWDAYFTRFMVISWLLIFPGIFFCGFWFIRELNKGHKIVVISSALKPFYSYGYFFHNLIFTFLSGAMILNTLFLIYTIFDTYIFRTNTAYEHLWNVTRSEVPSKSPHSKDDFIWGVVFLGYLFHIVSYATYAYHNLYHTDSWFGEKWRWFISINTSNRKLFYFKQRYPNIYNFLYPKFLDTSTFSKNTQKRKIITLD